MEDELSPPRSSHKEELNLNFVPAIRTTYTGYGDRKLNFSSLYSLYANLTRVVIKRRASLLGLVMGSQPGWSLASTTPVQLSSLESYSRTYL